MDELVAPSESDVFEDSSRRSRGPLAKGSPYFSAPLKLALRGRLSVVVRNGLGGGTSGVHEAEKRSFRDDVEEDRVGF